MYSKFTTIDLKNKFNLVVTSHEWLETKNLNTKNEKIRILKDDFEKQSKYLSFRLSEKARSEFLIAPLLKVLMEEYIGRICIFSGEDFSVDKKNGLNGVCDFIVSRSSNRWDIQYPVLMVFEAKKEDIAKGTPQCIAEMYAAQIFNKRNNVEIPAIYGVVTTGTVWTFIRLNVI